MNPFAEQEAWEEHQIGIFNNRKKLMHISVLSIVIALSLSKLSPFFQEKQP